MINTRLLQAHMVLNGVNAKDLADAQGWSVRNAYRKIKGETAFTVPEVQICKDLLHLDPPTANAIFFCRRFVLKDKNAAIARRNRSCKRESYA